MRAGKLLAFVGLACFICSMAAVAHAQNRTSGLEPKAGAVYKNVCNALDSWKNFSVQADILTDTVFEDGTKVQFGRVTTVDVRRPDHFRTVSKGDDFTFSSYFNGKTFTLVLPDKKRYGQIPAAMDTNALLDKLSGEYGLDAPLGDVLMNNVCDNVQPETGYYVGRTMVDGVACHHLLFQGEEVDWQLWVEDTARSLPRKLVITEKQLPGAPQFMAVFKNWKQGQRNDAAFVYTPSDDCSLDAGMFSNIAVTQQAAP